MKKLFLLLLFIPIVSFGQDYPFIISSEFQKLDDKEKEDFLFLDYNKLKSQEVSFADAYFKIKNNFEIYKRKGESGIYENILIYKSFNTKSLQEFLPKSIRSFSNSLKVDDEKTGTSSKIIESGFGIHKPSKLEYAFISNEKVWEELGDSLNYKRTSNLYYIKLSKEIKVEITINSKRSLTIDDILEDVVPFKDHYKSAMEKYDNGEYVEAIKSFDDAIDFIGGNYIMYGKRGNAKIKLKNYQAALEDFNIIIELYPDANTYYNRAICKYYLKNTLGACQDARKAQSLGYDASKLIKAACN